MKLEQSASWPHNASETLYTCHIQALPLNSRWLSVAAHRSTFQELIAQPQGVYDACNRLVGSTGCFTSAVPPAQYWMNVPC